MTIYNGWIHWQSTGTSHRERPTGIKCRASLRKFSQRIESESDQAFRYKDQRTGTIEDSITSWYTIS